MKRGGPKKGKVGVESPVPGMATTGAGEREPETPALGGASAWADSGTSALTLPPTARLLLDTHCWLWLLAAPDRLNAEVRRLIEDADRPMFLSSACAWEVAIKMGCGKLQLDLGSGSSPAAFVRAVIDELSAEPLPIRHEHALRVADLPDHHRDPFDRILIAQTLEEPEMYLVTADGNIARYAGLRIVRAN